ncbi:MAG TPA: hypothetical protein VFF11_17060, partial [Candidatus Binatia bacterium]|nr:hypothetical protein [Candidatus Binatia bacterium]
FAAGAFDPKYLSYYSVPPGPLAFGASGGSLTISWPGGAGLLQRSTNVAGPYTDVNGASSPYIISTTNAAEFFRLKQ